MEEEDVMMGAVYISNGIMVGDIQGYFVEMKKLSAVVVKLSLFMYFILLVAVLVD